MNKPKRLRRPAGAKFWTGQDVVWWIAANVYTSSSTTDEARTKAIEAAMWWLAIRYADSLSDLKRTELAEEILTGVGPLTMRDLTEELRAIREDDPATADAEIESALRIHFAV